MKRLFVSFLASLGLLLPATVTGFAATGKGQLFFNGGIVRTVVVPAPVPGGGRDAFYEVTNGAAGQLGITAVAPGSPGYHGGSWAVNLVSFKAGVIPYLLTSARAVLEAEAAGDATVVRNADLDFRCPVQP